MHILLTDLLTCPRCGPEFGLVMLADDVRERRVLAGALGCANCRETYPVAGGVADLRLAPGGAPPAPGAADEEAPVRLAALMGLAGAQGQVLVAGAGPGVPAGIRRLVPDVEVVALADAPVPGGEEAGVSRVAAAGRLPFRGGRFRAAAFAAAHDPLEALRVVAPGGRLVLENAPPDAASRLGAAGAELLLEQEGTVVARAPQAVRPGA